MSKGRPRHNPDKKQNKKGYQCDCYEILSSGPTCNVGTPQHIVETVCKGNPHNCCKVTYRKWGGKSEKDEKPHPKSQFTIVTKEGNVL